jgi:two-component system, OmpR family, sensor kinase
MTTTRTTTAQRPVRQAAEPVRNGGPPDATQVLPARADHGPLLASARLRILVAFGVLLALTSIAAPLLVRQILLSRLDNEVEQHLTQEIGEFRRLVNGIDPRTGEPFGTDARAILNVYFQRNVPRVGEVVLTYLDGRPYRSIAARDRTYPVQELFAEVRSLSSSRETLRATIDTSAGGARIIAVPLLANDRVAATFVAANFADEDVAAINDAVRVAALVALGLFAVAAVIGWAFAGRVLAPLRLLRDTARSITDTDLSRRIPVRGRDEVAQLAITFNDMVDRLQAGFVTQRRFTDDAGHELRTPITIIRGHLELLEDDPEERRQTLALVLDELDRMSRIVDDLILLAKAEQPDFLHPRPVDVGTLTEEVLSKVSALALRDWRLVRSGTGTLVADRQRLTQAVVQLAANAVRHTDEGGVIEIGSAVGPEEVRFWVRDEGPGIPLEEQERIFRRFARGGRRRSEGAGLGLAIVRAIVDAHRGRIELDSTVGAGSTFAIVVPLRPMQPSAAAAPAPRVAKGRGG